VWAEVKSLNSDKDPFGEWAETEFRLKNLYARTRGCGWTCRAAGAATGLGGGILAAAVGALLSAASWVRGDAAGGLSLHGVAGVLLLSTIPLLILGAHCLDLLEERAEESGQAAHEGGGSAPVPAARARSRVALGAASKSA
jgi:hypothetical protein